MENESPPITTRALAPSILKAGSRGVIERGQKQMIGSEWHTGQSTADWWIQLVKTKTVYCIYGTAYRVNPIGKVTFNLELKCFIVNNFAKGG